MLMSNVCTLHVWDKLMGHACIEQLRFYGAILYSQSLQAGMCDKRPAAPIHISDDEEDHADSHHQKECHHDSDPDDQLV